MQMADTAIALQAHWSRLRPLIIQAIPFMGGTHSEADLIKEALAGKIKFWAGTNAFVLAEVQKFPQITRCSLFLAGGDADECQRLRDRVIAWAKTQGATQFQLALRPALDRKNGYGTAETAAGWTRASITYTKDL